MKFYCDSCNTKYAIADDKVRGKILKVKCKHCGNIITVRELEAVATPPPSPPVPSAKVPQTNWHFSINGKSTGPMGLAALKAKYSAGEIGDETYVWHDTFDGWKPVATVAIFADALRQGFSQKPRFETHAYTGVSEAVQAEPSTERAGVVPQIIQPEAKPDIEKAAEKAKPETQLNEDRLDKLREKLSSSALKKPEIKPLQPKPIQEEVQAPISEAKAILPSFESESPEPEAALGFSPTIPDSGPAGFGADPIADTMLPDEINTGFAPLEDISDELPNFAESKPRDLFDPSADNYGQDTDDSDIMPFFPDDVNPSLGGDDAPSEVFTSSKSLLIELDKIKKTDRKKSVIFLLAGGAAFLLLASIGTYMYMNREIEEVVVVEKAEEREAKILSYSKDEIEAGFVELDDMVIGKEEAEEALAAEAKDEGKSEEKKKGKTKAPKEKENKTTIAKKVEKSPKLNDRKKNENTNLSPEEALRKKLLATGSAPINRPEDTLGTKTALKTGLTRVQAQAGFKKVSRSVSTCRQRHANRSGKELESAKVKISVEVLPTGKVSSFRISPGNLRHTAFDSCMKSKKETWRFAKFGGKPVKINRTFILQ